MEDIQDKIDNYLFGRISNAEVKEFEQEMASDNAVREQFLFTQMVKHELSDRNEKLRSVQQWRKQTDRNRRPNPIRRVLWYSIGGLSATAMVVLGVFLFRPEPISTTIVSTSAPYAQITSQIDISSKISPNEMSKDVHRNVMAYTANKSVRQNQSANIEYSSKKVCENEEIYQQISSVTASYTSYQLSSQNVAASMSSSDIYSQSQYERYMREVEYYQKQAENYRREAEYYKKQAEAYEREQQYYLKQAEKYQRNAADYSKRGDYDKAKTQTRYAQNEMDKAKTQASYAKSAWDKYKTQMNYAKNADEKAAMYLKYAREALR